MRACELFKRWENTPISSMLISKPGVTGQPHECREQLEVVIELSVVDDRTHIQVLPRLGLGTILGPQPAQRGPHQRIVVGLEAFDIAGDDIREIKATDELLEGLELYLMSRSTSDSEPPDVRTW